MRNESVHLLPSTSANRAVDLEPVGVHHGLNNFYYCMNLSFPLPLIKYINNIGSIIINLKEVAHRVRDVCVKRRQKAMNEMNSSQ